MEGRAIAIVGVGAILPDAPNAAAFWENIKAGRYSISEVRPDRWNPSLYYDPDPNAPDKTYSKIGGWVREYSWDPLKWHLPIPPKVAAAMDGTQRWAVACTRQALEDYGYPQRKLDPERTAVIVGNAMAGEMHYLTAIRAYMPECATEIADIETFATLPERERNEILREFRVRMGKKLPEITEDTMPGELSNCIAGRIANLFNFHGPNYVVDAACASAMAAISAAIEGLEENEYDLVVTGGIDRNMGPSTFIKFCKIGALSATGSRPYAEGADGFVMGEGGGILLLKRLADAEREGDRVYAVIRGIGGSSDGRGKGITAPNPIGQKLALERGWANAGLSPATATLIEGHGTSTKVGDVVEVQSLIDVLSHHTLPANRIALGSVKSNIGHLKAAAGAAGLLKTVFALRDKVLPPTVKFERPNPDIDFAHSPLYVNTELREWKASEDESRRAGVSAFGFGGTNFHTVLEEYIPGKIAQSGKRTLAFSEALPKEETGIMAGNGVHTSGHNGKPPLRGALVLGAEGEAQLVAKLKTVIKDAGRGNTPSGALPKDEDLRANERLAIDFGDLADLQTKAAKALKTLEKGKPAAWKPLALKGVFRGRGPAQKIAFLCTGQGSQYVNMLRPFRASEPLVASTFEEADEALTPLLGKPLSHYIFVDDADPKALAKAEDDLRQTAITQPAVLSTDIALARIMAAYGIQPDMTMGHSLGEYGALVAAGVLPFHDALEAVSARGREMTRVSVADNGKMAAVSGPIEEIEKVLKTVDGYVVIANLNSEHQAVIGGGTRAVEQAMEALQKAGFACVALQVSHAFHTSIVAPASEPLKKLLQRLHISRPKIPIVANVTGEFYPTGDKVEPLIVDLLARQVASPVQFVKGLNTLYNAGARVFVEVGPKKALHSFVEDVLLDRGDVVALYTNHPKIGDVASFNQALCGLYAAGHGRTQPKDSAEVVMTKEEEKKMEGTVSGNGDHYRELGKLFADVLERGWKIYRGETPGPPASEFEPVVITGAGIGLPGPERIFADSNVERILRGDQFIDSIPMRFRRAMLDKNITRLVKSETGGPSFETIHDMDEVIKLAGRGGAFDAEVEFGLPSDRVAALDRVTQLAIAAGLDAMRDAGIPLVMRYKTTSKGTFLPDRWGLPDCMRDDTGVIFASAFPGYDSLVDQLNRYHVDHARREQLAELEKLLTRAMEANSPRTLVDELQHKIDDLRAAIEREPYVFDRRFLFRTLSMGHSQLAEFIGARGPNTAINSACATTTQAISLAEDWIHAGRCKRVIIVSADDVTSDRLMEWFGAGFLATGAAATDEVVENAAVPFDKRRHGMIVGMGAAAFVVESAGAARERGIRPICEVLSTMTANSAFHATRLDVEHICAVMEQVIGKAERDAHLERHSIAPQTMFMSHETYTPARGGSASAEIHALRRVFGESADRIVIANTKGYTGHAMATGIEDVVAIKALETGIVPPVPNFKEVDPELGSLNLSRGGVYPIEYALRLGAGFGSQISMVLLRWVKSQDGSRPSASGLGYANRIAQPVRWNEWLQSVSGQPSSTLEVVKRTLRVRDQGAPAKTSVPVASVVKETRTGATSEATAVGAPQPLEVAKTSVSVPVPALTADAPIAAIHHPEPKQIKVEAATVVGEDAVKKSVLALVSEKTGYPSDMLDLDLDLEADLGIDTVKQAEVFAAIREMYKIPRDEKRRLRDYPTLAHVIRFVLEHKPSLETGGTGVVQEPVVAKSTVVETPSEAPTQAIVPPTVVQARSTVPQAATSDDSVKEKLLEIVVEKTGYPKEMLDLDLDLEADLGIDTVKQAELFAAVRELYKIPRDENRKLRDYPTLAHVLRFVHEHLPKAESSAAAPVVSQSAAPLPEVQPAPVTTATPTDSADDVAAKVLEIVAEKTGYPTEMLDLDLDLEADLGIDTVKQAEMFAAVRGAFDIPRDEHLKLRDFPTLQHVIRFAQERRNGAAAPQPVTETKTVEKARSPVPARFEASDRIPRRVPVPVPRPPLSLCKPTGVRLAAGTRVVLMPDQSGVGEELELQLHKLGVEVLTIRNAPDPQWLTGQLKTWMEAGPIHGVFWLPALDVEPKIADMTPERWHEAVRIRVKSLYVAMRALYEQVGKPGTFLCSAVRLGGQHGYDNAGATAPLGGAVAGFTKTYKRERADAICKVVDFEVDATPQQITEAIIAETLSDPGAVEIGYKDGQCWTVSLRELPATDGRPGLVLNKDTVFVVTGAAGSIVSAITADLAVGSAGTFHLLDLVPGPDPNNPDLKRFITDRDALKRDLFARIQDRGERATPALVERELAALERACAAQSAIDAVRIAGGKVQYHSVNLTDTAAVAHVIEEIRKESGHIDVLLHAAGMERSHFLPDKDPREFDLVFDVKCDGWFNLMHAIGNMPLRATVVFSSVAARFGNAGQTDYSAANDLLCKMTSQLRTTRPETRGIAIDWTAWGGIGMATRGSIPKMMEVAGIDKLPPEAGIPLIRRELTVGGTRGEVVIGQRLGVLMNESDSTGGVDATALSKASAGPMVGTVTGFGIHNELMIETTLDPKQQPFLRDHQIDSIPVMPGVMGIEAFAEAATVLLPDWHIEAVEDVHFLAALKYYHNEPRKFSVAARLWGEEENVLAECRLVSMRQLPGQAEPKETTHFTARVRLARRPAESRTGAVPKEKGQVLHSDDIYRIYFHGPAYQVLEAAWMSDAQMIGRMAKHLPGNHVPGNLITRMEPRLIELCFQTASLWRMSEKGIMGLPHHVDEVRLLRRPRADDVLYAVVNRRGEDSFDVDVVDSSGAVCLQVKGYTTVAVQTTADLTALRALLEPTEVAVASD
ncbi:MAG: SDR family NAD(P)-dependent oxidoreductase [Acidobacteriaceae bacterium]